MPETREHAPSGLVQTGAGRGTVGGGGSGDVEAATQDLVDDGTNVGDAAGGDLGEQVEDHLELLDAPDLLGGVAKAGIEGEAQVGVAQRHG